MIRLASRSEIATRSIRRTWASRGLAGVAIAAIRFAPARIVAARRNHCSLACWTCPNWWRIISCSTGGENGRLADRLDEVAVAGVGRDSTGGRVGMGQQPGSFEVGEDIPNGRARNAEPVSLDERGRSDGRCGRDIFLDDGPEDRFCAWIQRAGGAYASRHDGLSSCVGISTLDVRVLTNPSSRRCRVSTLVAYSGQGRDALNRGSRADYHPRRRNSAGITR